MSEAIEVEDRKYRLTTYEKCFIGTEAVQWLLETKAVDSIAEAVAVGNQMLRSGLLHHVLNEHPFKNSFLFYRFHLDPQDVPLMGSSGGSHSSGAYVAGVHGEFVRMQRLVAELHPHTSESIADPSAYIREQQSLAEVLVETLEDERRDSQEREHELLQRIHQLEGRLKEYSGVEMPDNVSDNVTEVDEGEMPKSWKTSQPTVVVMGTGERINTSLVVL